MQLVVHSLAAAVAMQLLPLVWPSVATLSSGMKVEVAAEGQNIFVG